MAAGGPLKRIAALCLIGALVAPCAASDPDSDRVGRQAPRRPSVSSPDLPPLPPPARQPLQVSDWLIRVILQPDMALADRFVGPRLRRLAADRARAEGHWPKPDREPLKRLEFP